MGARADFVADQLAAVADADKAAGAAGYMYGRRFQRMYPDPAARMPYFGVQKPLRASILRELLAEYPVRSVEDYRAAIAELWQLPHREVRYIALGLASSYPEYHRLGQVDLFRSLIVTGGWWDLVDDIAARCVGGVLLADRAEMTPLLDRWIEDEDLWIRRTALISHLKHKGNTDAGQLFDHCERTAHEAEFFIRKAIGWALREYAKTDPAAVRRFLTKHRGELSGLSYREASKHLDVA